MTGATKSNDPQHFPRTIGFISNYQSEGRIYAEYLLKNHRQGKSASSIITAKTTDGLNGKTQTVVETPSEATDPNR
jgi:branched-chain amino acid transport system substrate-binding protein